MATTEERLLDFILGPTRDVSNMHGAPCSVDQHLIYDSRNGYLWYDADGSGRGKADLVAVLSQSLNMMTAKFEVV